MTYYYEAHDKFGQPVNGKVEAESEEQAAKVIRDEGHYAREISTEPVKAKYEVPDVGVGKSSTGEEAPPHKVSRSESDAPVQKKATKREVKNFIKTMENRNKEAKGEPILTRDRILKDQIEGVSEVLRLMSTWSKAYKEAQENEKEFQPGFPVVGGKTWEIFDANKQDFGKALILEAMKRSAF